MSETPPPRDELLVETRGRVRVLTLNRPRQQNALSISLHNRLVDAFLEAGADPEVWVIVLTASGDGAFCAGRDLKEQRPDGPGARSYQDPVTGPRRLIYEVIAETWKPTIAAVSGAAVGAGFELALACDLRVGAEGMRFGLPEARVGMGATYASVVLPRMAPLGIALEMMFTGQYLSDVDALRWGLLNRLTTRERLLSEAISLAETIAANAPLSTRRMKQMAMKGLSLPITAALRLDVGPNPYTSEDRREGVRAFREKRPPQWKGR